MLDTKECMYICELLYHRLGIFELRFTFCHLVMIDDTSIAHRNFLFSFLNVTDENILMVNYYSHLWSVLLLYCI